jgi:hypothetical protein
VSLCFALDNQNKIAVADRFKQATEIADATARLQPRRRRARYAPARSTVLPFNLMPRRASSSSIGTARARSFLRDTDVVVLPDNDEPGHNHADDVGQSLQTGRAVMLKFPLRLAVPGAFASPST